MTLPNPRYLVLTLAVMVIIGATVALKAIVKPKHRGRFRIDLITTVAGSQGKILKINDNKGGVAEYPCGPADAAVAVLSVSNDLQGSAIRLEAQTGKDENGSRYSVGLHKVSSFFFVTVHKGFSHIPRSVTVKLWVYAMKDERVQSYTSYNLTFKQFALPVRTVVPLTGPDLIEAEKHAYAEYVLDRQDLIVNIPPTERSGYEVLAKSFQSNENMKIALDENPVAQSVYDDQSDAVMVSLRSSKPTESTWNLTYRGAEVRVVEGRRFLWFPKTESSGLLNHEKSSIQETSANWNGIKMKNRSDGEIKINVAPSGQFRSPLDVVSLDRISPSLEEIGLSSVGIDIPSLGFHLSKRSAPNLKLGTMKKIPKLTLQFTVKGMRTIPGATYRLPVHRVQSSQTPLPPRRR